MPEARYHNPACRWISDEQSSAYVHELGVRCPHCRSEDISTDDEVLGVLGDVGKVVRCQNCDEEWVEVYEMRRIEHLRP